MTRLALAAILAVAGCAGPAVSVPAGPAPSAEGPSRDVWVVGHGWHTRIAVRGADVDPAVWPESRDFGEAPFLEVGWGDRDFYPDPSPSVLDALDPVVRATPAALHVGALDAAPPERFAGQPVIRLAVPAAGLARLVRFVRDHYARDAAGRAVRIGPGYYPRSAFYQAAGRYHVLTYNSNRWVASALQAAGAPVEPGAVVTSGAVLRQAAAVAARQRAGSDGPR